MQASERESFGNMNDDETSLNGRGRGRKRGKREIEAGIEITGCRGLIDMLTKNK